MRDANEQTGASSWGLGGISATCFGLLALGAVRWSQVQAGLAGEGALLLPTLIGLVGIGLFAHYSGRTAGGIEWGLALAATAITSDLWFDLPTSPGAAAGGDTPLLRWIVPALGMAVGGFCLCRPRWLKTPELCLWVLVLFAAGNGKVWTRSNFDFYPLYASLVGILLCAPKVEFAAVKERSFLQRSFAPLALLFVAVTLIAGQRGFYPGNGDVFGRRLILGCTIGLMAGRVLDGRGVRRILHLVAMGGAAAWVLLPVVLEAHQHLGWDQIWSSRLRLFGLHPNLTGTFLAVQLAIAATLAAGEKGRRRWLWLLILLPCALGLYWTRSRTAWVAALVGLCVPAIYARISVRLWRRLAIGASLVAVVVVSVPSLRSGLWNAILRPASSGQSVSQRLFLWDASAKLVAERPLLGIGAGNFFAHGRHAASPSYFDNTDRSLHPHNLLLSVAEGTGLVGLGVFLLLAAVVLWSILKLCKQRGAAADAVVPSIRAREHARSRSGTVLLAGFAALFSGNLFDLGLSQMTFLPLLFWILGGCAQALVRERAADSESKRSAGRELGDAPSKLVPVRGAVVLGAWVLFLLAGVRPFAAERFFQAGLLLETETDPEPALLAWERTSTLLPFDLAPVLRRAELCADNRRRNRAQELFEQAVALSPENPRPHWRQAVFFKGNGLWEQAEASARRALELDPHSPLEGSLRLHLADCLAQMGRADAASSEFARAMLLVARFPAESAEAGGRVRVRGGEDIDLIALMNDEAAGLIARAGEQQAWQNRRQANNLARLLRQFDRNAVALDLLQQVQAAQGHGDTSLLRLQLEIEAELGRASGSEVEAFEGRGDHLESLASSKIEAGLADEVLADSERQLQARMDMHFDAEYWMRLHRSRFDACAALKNWEQARESLDALWYFGNKDERIEFITQSVSKLSRAVPPAFLMELVGRGIDAAGVQEHPATRERSLLLLAEGAVKSVRQGSAQNRLERIEERLGADSGYSRLLFDVILRLQLAPEAPALELEARADWELLRARYPREGQGLAVYFGAR